MRYEDRKVLTTEEEERFLSTFTEANHYTRYRTPHRDYVLCRLLLATGLRVGEAVALRWEHVNLALGRLLVREGDGALERTLWFDEGMADLLAGWREREDVEVGPEELVFTTRGANPLGRRQLWKMIRRRGEKAGLTGEDSVSPSVLRDTFAVDRLEKWDNNVDLVQKALGHADRSLTVRMYVGMTREPESQKAHV